MATLVQRPKVEVTTLLGLDEGELRAIRALTEYGNKSVLEAIQKGISEGLVRDHGEALGRVLDAVRKHAPNILSRAEAAREAFNE